MESLQGRVQGVVSLLCVLPACLWASQAHALSEIIVTTSREATLRADTPISISVVDESEIDSVRAGHPSEIMGRVPGVSVQPTNGEGSIVGIRLPIGTSPVYLYLEDGVPIRASGFFNHNALYEMNLPQAGGIEVIRGPGTALQGSDAIGGVINVLTRAPSKAPELSTSLEAGSYGWLRGLFTASDSWADSGARVDLNITHSDGWRDRSGYDRQTITLRADHAAGGSRLKAVLSATNIDQDTGATSFLSEADYRDDPTRNYTPFAYRKVRSARASVEWEQDLGAGLATVTPYLRWSDMEILPTWMLSYDPVVYTTSYYSVGALLKYRQDFPRWHTRVITGVDLDYSPGWRREDRIWAVRNGPVYESYTDQGRIYDYDVTFWQASPYLQVEAEPVDRLHLTAGLRFDRLGFQYDNHLPDGSFQTSNGPVPPAAQRTFHRPADQSEGYDRLSPSVGATYAFTRRLNGFVAYKQSFRVPQEGQLYRQGASQDSTRLKPVKAGSYEIGLRATPSGTLSLELSAYTMSMRDDILTYNDGSGPTQTNNGKTRHRGIEAALAWQFLPEWHLDVAASHARSEYGRWVAFTGGTNVDFSGNVMPSAPENVDNVVLGYKPGRIPGLSLEAELAYMGSYWLDDANTTKYDGHKLVNLRLNYATPGNWQFFLRMSNLLDARWANSGRVANGQPEFAPGLPFTLYAGIGRKF
ncbi:MAG: TonB-dependent receptor [Gammaproteobacteria bacterium PRO9]|nr:TonB-dependent receptor [Gammaproteobacteria bacterium PRO9]